MKIRLSLSLLLAAFSLALPSAAYGQQGTIKGTVRDDRGEALEFATVWLMQNGAFMGGANVDKEGNYQLKTVEPGIYELRFSYAGESKVLNLVVVEPGMIARHDFVFVTDMIPCFCGGEYFPPLYYFPLYPENQVVDAEMLEETGIRNPLDAVSMASPAVYQADQGEPIHLAGGRNNANQVYIDGVKTIGEPGLPQSSIDEVHAIIYGSTPAEYGDFIGGVVIINTQKYVWKPRIEKDYDYLKFGIILH